MRLPGTLNFTSNGLPTPTFLTQYQALKEKQKAHQTDESKTNTPANQTVDKKPNNTKDAPNAKDAEGRTPTDGKPTDGGGFTKAQDDALVDLKLKETPWKAIATELGKEVNQLKERFKAIKPDDFDKKLMEAKNSKKEDKKAGEGGGKDNKSEVQNQGGGGGGKGGKKGKAQAQIQTQEAESGEDKEWWQQPDENWSKGDLQTLLEISGEELKNAFVQMSMRLADEKGKEVHPASIAEKILGRKLEWT